MPEIGETGVAFTMVAREWRAKYAMDADGTPAKSTALKAAQALLAEYLPKLKEIPSAEITRVVCGGCGDFKVIINQPAAEHGGTVKMASWRRHIWPPRAPPTAPGGGGLLSALLCRGAAPQIPPRGRGLGIRRHHTHRLRCVLTTQARRLVGGQVRARGGVHRQAQGHRRHRARRDAGVHHGEAVGAAAWTPAPVAAVVIARPSRGVPC